MNGPSTQTRGRTLWSETQLEMLYMALNKDYPDARVLEIVTDLTDRGMPVHYLVEKVQDECGAIGAGRVRRIARHAGS